MLPRVKVAAPNFSPDAFSGQKFGSYELVCKLATGGMSELFLALRRGEAGFSKLVVLKRVRPEVAQDADFVGRLLEEGNLMGAFTHPNIAQVFDVGKEGDEYFLVLEFVPGVTLLELISAATSEAEPLPVGFSLAVAREAALALHHAHAFTDQTGAPRPVIHRDVAPKNIMVSYDGDTKLLDFGVAKTSHDRTQVGSVVGTPAYMSPEQASLKHLDPRSDVFSLGVTLHESLTGRRLFGGTGISDTLSAVQHQPILPPSASNGAVPAAVDEAVLRALDRSRELRFQTARDFARALELAAGSELWGADRVAAVVEHFFSSRRAEVRQALTSLARSPAVETRVDAPAPTVVEPRAPPRPRRARIFAAVAIAGAVAIALAVAAGRAVWKAPDPAPPTPPSAVTRAPAPVSEPAPPAAPPPPAVEPPRVAAARVEPPRVERPPRAAAATHGSGASLWVKVRPWAKVYVDGKARGETPLEPFAVSAGKHSVLLVNDRLRLRRSYDVEVHPNQQQELKVVLDE
jgi:hypothetical protein